LLPLALATKNSAVPPSGKTAVLIVAFVLMGIALAAMAYLWYLIRGSIFGFFERSPPVPGGFSGSEPAATQTYNKM